MKKTTLKILSLILILTVLLSLAACDIAFGTYTLKAAAIGGLRVSLENMDSLGIDPDECYLKMSPFGSAELSFRGEITEMKYGDGKIWPADDENSKEDLIIDGDEITIEAYGIQLIFGK